MPKAACLSLPEAEAVNSPPSCHRAFLITPSQQCPHPFSHIVQDGVLGQLVAAATVFSKPERNPNPGKTRTLLHPVSEMLQGASRALTTSRTPSQEIQGFPCREPAEATQGVMAHCPFTGRTMSSYCYLNDLACLSEGKSRCIYSLTTITVTTVAGLDPSRAVCPLRFTVLLCEPVVWCWCSVSNINLL